MSAEGSARRLPGHREVRDRLGRLRLPLPAGTPSRWSRPPAAPLPGVGKSSPNTNAFTLQRGSPTVDFRPHGLRDLVLLRSLNTLVPTLLKAQTEVYDRFCWGRTASETVRTGTGRRGGRPGAAPWVTPVSGQAGPLLTPHLGGGVSQVGRSVLLSRPCPWTWWTPQGPGMGGVCAHTESQAARRHEDR